jgi:hypothetical protein
LSVKEDDEDHPNTMILSLVVPYELTQNAGVLPFAIRIVKNAYTWQTKPSSLTILKNLFRLKDISNSPAAMSAYEKVLAEINKVGQDVTENTEAIELMSEDIDTLQETDKTTAATIAEMQNTDSIMASGIQGLQNTTATLNTNLESTTNRVSVIEESDIYGVDDNADDNEIIFGGGGAPIEEA